MPSLRGIVEGRKTGKFFQTGKGASPGDCNTRFGPPEKAI